MIPDADQKPKQLVDDALKSGPGLKELANDALKGGPGVQDSKNSPPMPSRVDEDQDSKNSPTMSVYQKFNWLWTSVKSRWVKISKKV